MTSSGNFSQQRLQRMHDILARHTEKLDRLPPCYQAITKPVC